MSASDLGLVAVLKDKRGLELARLLVLPQHGAMPVA
jgi:hypothetical protein